MNLGKLSLEDFGRVIWEEEQSGGGYFGERKERDNDETVRWRF